MAYSKSSKFVVYIVHLLHLILDYDELDELAAKMNWVHMQGLPENGCQGKLYLCTIFA